MPINGRYAYYTYHNPDVELMREAAKYIVGEHDFKSFCGNPNFKKSTLRTIYNISIHCDGPYITFTYHGDGFLQNMELTKQQQIAREVKQKHSSTSQTNSDTRRFIDKARNYLNANSSDQWKIRNELEKSINDKNLFFI